METSEYLLTGTTKFDESRSAVILDAETLKNFDPGAAEFGITVTKSTTPP